MWHRHHRTIRRENTGRPGHAWCCAGGFSISTPWAEPTERARGPTRQRPTETGHLIHPTPGAPHLARRRSSPPVSLSLSPTIQFHCGAGQGPAPYPVPLPAFPSPPVSSPLPAHPPIHLTLSSSLAHRDFLPARSAALHLLRAGRSIGRSIRAPGPEVRRGGGSAGLDLLLDRLVGCGHVHGGGGGGVAGARRVPAVGEREAGSGGGGQDEERQRLLLRPR